MPDLDPFWVATRVERVCLVLRPKELAEELLIAGVDHAGVVVLEGSLICARVVALVVRRHQGPEQVRDRSGLLRGLVQLAAAEADGAGQHFDVLNGAAREEVHDPDRAAQGLPYLLPDGRVGQ
ncbi:uncharacterized protein PG986_001177 [Apiospora aurea]|uniref:Uncharacterized protein n=1 Tax=Apiospora aurea TaxID=335848 RepID=A0ABR1QXU4_9PEZI